MMSSELAAILSKDHPTEEDKTVIVQHLLVELKKRPLLSKKAQNILANLKEYFSMEESEVIADALSLYNNLIQHQKRGYRIELKNHTTTKLIEFKDVEKRQAN